MQYMVNLIFDEEFGGYVADVPQLPGCMSQGKTVEEAMVNIKEAIALYLESDPSAPRGTGHPPLTALVEV